MEKKDPPPRGVAPSNGATPQGKGSFLRGVVDRFLGQKPEVIECQAEEVRPQPSNLRTYSRELVADLLNRIRRQNAHITYLNGVLRSTSDALIVAEPSGKITMFNKGAEDMFQIDEQLALGDNLFRLCADSAIEGAKISAMLISDQRIRNLRVEINGTQGRRTVALMTIDFVREPAGLEPAAIVAILKDNTALEDAHLKLKEAYEQVERLSLTDERTGLFNSRYFTQKLGDEYERMLRGHMEEVSLLIVDADHFKAINDTHGHHVGDEVLKLISAAIKESVRKIDIPCRYGGEEFAIILPSTNEAGAWALAERIRKKVGEIRLPSKKGTVTVTCSIGVTTHRRGSGSHKSFFEEADRAVYSAKHAGRNRTVAHGKAA